MCTSSGPCDASASVWEKQNEQSPVTGSIRKGHCRTAHGWRTAARRAMSGVPRGVGTFRQNALPASQRDSTSSGSSDRFTGARRFPVSNPIGASLCTETALGVDCRRGACPNGHSVLHGRKEAAGCRRKNIGCGRCGSVDARGKPSSLANGSSAVGAADDVDSKR